MTASLFWLFGLFSVFSCGQDDFHYSSDYQFRLSLLQILFKHLTTIPSAPTIIGIPVNLRFTFFLVLWEGESICFSCKLTLRLVFWPRSGEPFESQNP